ncbi:MAG: hypothetical protein HC781_19710 [Leptolyngbyaceae cyanobacterium CSU_1_4]|nr:hypothetical protein [Leptolyngbyaceae cyanobacterium CSU_1_4]
MVCPAERNGGAYGTGKFSADDDVGDESGVENGRTKGKRRGRSRLCYPNYAYLFRPKEDE